jgi:S-adenosylmethionine decarboxylase
MYSIAPEIFRNRLLIEGFFTVSVDAQSIIAFFAFLTGELNLKTYGEPFIHTTSGAGKAVNQGYDAFVPLIDSGIYLAVWGNQKFLSLIIYTCKDFDETKALQLTKEYFRITKSEHTLF